MALLHLSLDVCLLKPDSIRLLPAESMARRSSTLYILLQVSKNIFPNFGTNARVPHNKKHACHAPHPSVLNSALCSIQFAAREFLDFSQHRPCSRLHMLSNLSYRPSRNKLGGS